MSNRCTTLDRLILYMEDVYCLELQDWRTVQKFDLIRFIS